jgi:hypothetical protein
LLAGSPNARYRVELPRQSEYSIEGAFVFAQAVDRVVTISIIATPAYDGTASAWDVAVPDFTTASGFDVNWGLGAGAPTYWTAIAVGGSFATGLAQSASRSGLTPE